MSEVDIPTFGAPQNYSTAINVPCFVGWTLQILLCGIATDRSYQFLRQRQGNYGRIPYAKTLFITAVLLNAITGIATFWSIVAWGADQDRTLAGISTYKTPDVISSGAGGLVSVAAQSFMAIRCWRILRKSTIFAVLISLGIATVLAGTVWMTIASARFLGGGEDENALFSSTEIWLWGSVLVDLTITICLTRHLSSLKQGFNPRTDSVVHDLIRLAFETCALPLLFAVAGAIMYITTWQSVMYWNLCTVAIASISSVYVLSIVHCLYATAEGSDRLGGHTEGLRLQLPVTRTEPSLSKRSAPRHEQSPHALSHLSQSWQPPAEWASIGGIADCETAMKRPSAEGQMSSQPFMAYANSAIAIPQLSQSASPGHRIENDRLSTSSESDLIPSGPFAGLRIRVEKEVTVEKPSSVHE